MEIILLWNSYLCKFILAMISFKKQKEKNKQKKN